MDARISLVGNPNVGKTSLYNRITHSLENVGNWHGVTVSEVSKSILYDHQSINIVDLPGLYSLTVYSPEESITRDNVISKQNDLIVSVCEVNNLSRNLYLTLQLLELDLPVVLVINMMDELKKQGKSLNYRKIEKELGIPIIPMSAKYHSDIHLLMDVSLDYISTFKSNQVKLEYLDKLPLKQVEEIIKPNAEKAGLDLRYCSIKVLEKDEFIATKLDLSDEQKSKIDALGDLQATVAQARYEFIDKVTAGAISKTVNDEHHEMHEHIAHSVPLETENSEDIEGESLVAKHKRHHDMHKNKAKHYMQAYSPIDKIVLNKYLALPIFLLIMCAVFFLTFGLVGAYLTELLEIFFENCVYNPVVSWLTDISAPDWVIGLVGEGIINGVSGVLVFLPQVVLLFFFLAIMEDSGYISRVAFMTDGLFRKIGLSGRSVFTMLMGFGCSATAVLTARGLEDETMRKKTVILTPFMSCTARLPIYTVIASMFFAQGQFLVIFGLYALGAVISLAISAIFEKTKKLKSGKLSFIMEMPPYRFPTFERVIQILLHNTKVFLVKVGTVVFALNVIVWFLSNFSITAGYVGNEGSILAWFSGLIAPVFAPMGFGNWRAVTSLMSGLVAKEVVVSSIESLGGIGLIFTGDYTSASALAFLVFTLLYVPCIATLVAQAKEVGVKWMAYRSLCNVAYHILPYRSVYGKYRAYGGNNDCRRCGGSRNANNNQQDKKSRYLLVRVRKLLGFVR